jgi:hypothetical protein
VRAAVNRTAYMRPQLIKVFILQDDCNEIKNIPQRIEIYSYKDEDEVTIEEIIGRKIRQIQGRRNQQFRYPLKVAN